MSDRTIDGFALITDCQQFGLKYPNRLRLPLIPYRNATFSSDAREFDYAILSHFPLDLAINTYVKSPNKMIAALVAGLIPVVSATPGYSGLLEAYGLQDYVFASPRELARILQGLNPAVDSMRVRESGIVAALVEDRSVPRLVETFLAILARHEAGDQRPAA